ncbi:MAG: L,D-transpeptidase family protein [Anaerolineae bacterium]|nr:L,D-transpeptidase family protein [Anaerolineae bacterium]
MQPQPPVGTPPQPPAPRRSPLQSAYVLVGGLLTVGSVFVLILVALAALLLYGGESASRAAPQPDIAPGVTVAGLPVGSASIANAQQLITIQNFGAQPVILTDGARQWTLTMTELGISVDAAITAQLASDAATNAAVQPWYTVDLSQTQTALIALSAQANIVAVPGNPGQVGRAMQIPELLNRLYNNLTGEIADGVLELAMVVVEPPEPEPVVTYTGVTTTHIVEAGQELALIARLYGVDLYDIVALNDLTNPDLLYVGQELTIPAAGLYSPAAANAPPAPTNVGKSIVVSTQQQRIFAYENGQLVHSYLTSTGLPDTPTVLGDYSIYRKYEKTDMRGPDYFLPDVPYTMYFYQGYGIHGTYWHNSFGRPMSHGCVNLPTEQAQWFFDWAEVGTPVRVI